AAVGARDLLGRSHDHAPHDLALLHLRRGRGLLDAADDDVADRRVAALRSTEHLDAHDSTSSAVVGDVEDRLRLNHGENTFPWPQRLTLLRTRGPKVD